MSGVVYMLQRITVSTLFFLYLSASAEVASTNLEIDEAKLLEIVAAGGDLGDYYSGTGAMGEERLYLSDLLANPDDAFMFDVVVPDDNTLYGSDAGKTIPYAGIILYPTSASNDRADYEEPGGIVLPHMQKAGETPIFEDAAQRYPLIVYSHGSGGYPLWMLPTLARFAGNGYIVMALFHGDGRFKGIGSDLMQFQRIALRPLSVKKAIDLLEDDPAFKDHIEFEWIGAVGLSLGASTTMALLGGEVIGPTEDSTRPTTIAPRIKAAANFIPWLGNNSFSLFGSRHKGVENVSRPYMVVAGTDDMAASFDVTKASWRSSPVPDI